jgi:hypothetical protein
MCGTSIARQSHRLAGHCAVRAGSIAALSETDDVVAVISHAASIPEDGLSRRPIGSRASSRGREARRGVKNAVTAVAQRRS